MVDGYYYLSRALLACTRVRQSKPGTPPRRRRAFSIADLLRPLSHCVRGRRVLDFGCGTGADCLAMARAGAAEVWGFDVQAGALDEARRRCRGASCTFANPDAEDLDGLASHFDLIVSVDSFEHVRDPAAALRRIAALLHPRGRAFVSFGPPWLHPRGGHIGYMTRLPWAHLLLSERSIMDVRRRYEDDGATRFEDVPGGLNRMTVSGFLELVAASGLRLTQLDVVPVKGQHWLTRNRVSRELFTGRVTASLGH